MYKDIFLELGLSQNEAVVYEYLLQKGETLAGQIIKNTPLKRGVVYNALDDLAEKGLITKQIRNKVFFFSPNHPEKLTVFAEDKEKQLQKARTTLEANLSALVSTFSLVSSQPGVRYMEGIDGLKKAYKDVLKTGQDVLLFRSVLDNNSEEVDAIIKRQLKLQVPRNIHTRAITPLVKGTPESVLTKDAERLVERRLVPKEKLSLPAQILIYANKVAITSFEKNLVTTLIENEAIAISFKVIFELLWELSTPIHDKMYRDILAGKATEASPDFSE